MLVEKLRALVLLPALLATAPAYAGTASLIVVHGIPGRAVASTLDPALPVDVLVDGKYCLLQGFTYGNIAGPIDVPAGTYTIAVSLANPLAPCSNSAVISASATLKTGEFGAIAAQLTTAGAPTLGVYPVDVKPIAAGMQRFVTVHAADAPAVTVHVTSLGKNPEKANFPIKPDTEVVSSVPTRDAFLVDVQAGSTIFGPITVTGGDQSLFFIAAVGGGGGTVNLISKVIPNVF